MAYDQTPEEDDCVMTREEFVESVKLHSFIDYDGFGHPIKEGKFDKNIDVYPSLIGTGRDEPSEIWGAPKRQGDLPTDATHIVWYNR